MENILLTFIICLILAGSIGINIVIRILRSIPIMGPGAYGHPMLPPGQGSSPAPERKGGISFTWLLLIVTAISFWLMIANKMQSEDSEKNPVIPQLKLGEDSTIEKEDQGTIPGIDYHRSEREPPETRIEKQTEPPTTVRMINYNRKPNEQRELPRPFHCLQLGAFTSMRNAKKRFRKYSGKFENVMIISHNRSFRVVIGPFANKKKATDFKKTFRLDGFAVEY